MPKAHTPLQVYGYSLVATVLLAAVGLAGTGPAGATLAAWAAYGLPVLFSLGAIGAYLSQTEPASLRSLGGFALALMGAAFIGGGPALSGDLISPATAAMLQGAGLAGLLILSTAARPGRAGWPVRLLALAIAVSVLPLLPLPPAAAGPVAVGLGYGGFGLALAIR